MVLTPNMIRFLALKLSKNDQTLLIKIGNIIVSSNNRVRLFTRVTGSAFIRFFGALVTSFPYGILMLVLYFNATENCGHKCSNYFEQLPKERPAQIYGEEATSHFFIRENDQARQIEIYIPSKASNEVTVSNNGKLRTTRTYIKVRKKAKEVKFSDFKQIDPVL